ncbi:MAG: VanZ family protein [Actinomycetes bacterium]
MAEATRELPRVSSTARGVFPVLAVLAGLAVTAQFYGLYRPSVPSPPPWFPGADKLLHALGFALPVLLVLAAVRIRGWGRGVPTALGLFALQAVVSELAQHRYYRYRTGDPYDLLADVLGIAAGWLANRSLTRQKSGT